MKKGKWAALFIGMGLGSVFLGSFALLLSVVEGISNWSTFPDHVYIMLVALFFALLGVGLVMFAQLQEIVDILRQLSED